ncbi:protein NRT1/ PTR FAMILY 2.8-like [Cucumis melo var. makuwa]|uniref:Protein NRT1/ PTR FAMILY 2.8-like n=1 Tax=Cucumis melo var. makuwa TaxID=1194695 RepID=A0A5D3DJD3_CUCMM|nr:protein NRT1/ PTR FAMILY 2.8-like [Cucumis melo var. makuwa]TYK23588.1 protein NRT1/ PTR FAMILY 2.8-like [Cucumis melo var. makuwa]
MENGNLHSSLDASRKKETRGGWRAVRFILGNETFEKLASMSLIGNLVLYLHTMYNLDNVASAYVFQIWGGTTNFAPLAGAFLADTYLGRFYTLLFGSIASLLGMGVLTLGAGLPQMRPPPCISGESNCPQPLPWQLSFLYLGLGLIVIGAGGIRPCNISFGADQFDTNTEKGRAKLESFLNWWYFLFSVALVIALTIVVYVQTNVSWTLGFGIPTACFVFSISIFLLGHRYYICKAPQGSVFADIAKVVVATCRKRQIPKPTQFDQLHNPPMNSSKLAHTNRFLIFDKAATVVDSSVELDEDGKSKNEWRLCSVHQVEEFKCVVGIIPVWTSFPNPTSLDEFNSHDYSVNLDLHLREIRRTYEEKNPKQQTFLHENKDRNRDRNVGFMYGGGGNSREASAGRSGRKQVIYFTVTCLGANTGVCSVGIDGGFCGDCGYGAFDDALAGELEDGSRSDIFLEFVIGELPEQCFDGDSEQSGKRMAWRK